MRSITGFPTLARSAYGLVKYPTFSAANSGASPVMNTAEHIILANPEVWCSRASPGGGTYGVLISNDFALAISASLSGLRRCDQIVAVARVTANKKTSVLLILLSPGSVTPNIITLESDAHKLRSE